MNRHIDIDIGQQRLRLYAGEQLLHDYPVSTALAGAGEQQGSGCTPRGRHRVRIKIGAGCAPGSVFVGRRHSGEVYSPALAAAAPARDWILTRILWLSGLETGRNRGGDHDTLRRFIYIHGTPDSEPMGEPRSHGCVRMRNADIIELFEQVPVGCPVDIHE